MGTTRARRLPYRSFFLALSSCHFFFMSARDTGSVEEDREGKESALSDSSAPSGTLDDVSQPASLQLSGTADPTTQPADKDRRTCKICSKLIRYNLTDPHNICVECRGKICDADDRCSECLEWEPGLVELTHRYQNMLLRRRSAHRRRSLRRSASVPSGRSSPSVEVSSPARQSVVSQEEVSTNEIVVTPLSWDSLSSHISLMINDSFGKLKESLASSISSEIHAKVSDAMSTLTLPTAPTPLVPAGSVISTSSSLGRPASRFVYSNQGERPEGTDQGGMAISKRPCSPQGGSLKRSKIACAKVVDPGPLPRTGSGQADLEDELMVVETIASDRSSMAVGEGQGYGHEGLYIEHRPHPKPGAQVADSATSHQLLSRLPVSVVSKGSGKSHFLHGPDLPTWTTTHTDTTLPSSRRSLATLPPPTPPQRGGKGETTPSHSAERHALTTRGGVKMTSRRSCQSQSTLPPPPPPQPSPSHSEPYDARSDVGENGSVHTVEVDVHRPASYSSDESDMGHSIAAETETTLSDLYDYIENSLSLQGEPSCFMEEECLPAIPKLPMSKIMDKGRKRFFKMSDSVKTFSDQAFNKLRDCLDRKVAFSPFETSGKYKVYKIAGHEKEGRAPEVNSEILAHTRNEGKKEPRASILHQDLRKVDGVLGRMREVQNYLYWSTSAMSHISETSPPNRDALMQQAYKASVRAMDLMTKDIVALRTNVRLWRRKAYIDTLKDSFSDLAKHELRKSAMDGEMLFDQAVVDKTIDSSEKGMMTKATLTALKRPTAGTPLVPRRDSSGGGPSTSSGRSYSRQNTRKEPYSVRPKKDARYQPKGRQSGGKGASKTPFRK